MLRCKIKPINVIKYRVFPHLASFLNTFIFFWVLFFKKVKIEQEKKSKEHQRRKPKAMLC